MVVTVVQAAALYPGLAEITQVLVELQLLVKEMMVEVVKQLLAQT
jgi:hypothetical protein